MNKVHGLRWHPVYIKWDCMKQRCENKNHKSYQDYGGRGIGICEEWLNNPASFIEWSIANGWRPSLTIDRIDNDKGYSPDNCRYVTDRVNTANRGKHKNNTTGFIGVCKYKKGYRAHIRFKGKSIALYGHKKRDTAALARDITIVKNKWPHTLNYPRDFVEKMAALAATKENDGE